ncbi:MAG TPA: zinc ribbon domain-containing protein [Thermoanaerobaculia bacterium]|nr:zinc ribbon domain-containing protein [Thermoanaerobaculia bacterium]
MTSCPKCGAAATDGAEDCLHCGVVFSKWESVGATSRVWPDVVRSLPFVERPVADGRIGPHEMKILVSGLIAAAIIYALPLTRFMISALVTLFHEFGHAVVGWLLGCPSIPAFDFVYGGGFTNLGEFRPLLAVGIAGVFGYAAWLFRENRTTVALIAAIFTVWLIFVSAEWRRELAIAAAGHASEFILAGILFYQALSGVGWKNPDLERPFGAFAAFFVQIHSMGFAWRLAHDPDFLAVYLEGKGGALMNDLEVVALDLNIYLGWNPGVVGVAKLLFFFSLLPITIALIWYFQRARWHRVMRALRTADA